MPTTHFSSTQRVLGGAHLSLFINPKVFRGCPPLTFHPPKGFLRCHLSLFTNPKVFWGCPPLTFHQPKGFLGVPTSHFLPTNRYLGVPTSHFSQICVFQLAKNPGALFLSYTLSAWDILHNEKLCFFYNQ